MESQPGPALLGLHTQGGAGQDRRLARPRLPGQHQRLTGRLNGGQPPPDAVEGDSATAEQVPATSGAALPARPPGIVAARLTRLGPGHQPGPGQPRPYPGDQRDRHEPVKPAPFGPFHQDPGQGVPGSVDDRPAAVTGESARIAEPVELHRAQGGRARHRKLPPHPVKRPLSQRIAEHLHPARRPRGRPHRHRRGQPARPVLAQVEHGHVHPRTSGAQVDTRRGRPARLPACSMVREF